MKTKLNLLPLIMILFAGLALSACSKSDDPGPVPTPKYPQLKGTWMGFTSQNDTVIFVVNNVDAKLNLYRYKYAISYQEGGYYQRVSTDISGITNLFNTDNSFAISTGTSVQDSLTGKFDVNAMTLSGSIIKEFGAAAGKPVVKVTYTATKQ